jgi:hypothetical protein
MLLAYTHDSQRSRYGVSFQIKHTQTHPSLSLLSSEKFLALQPTGIAITHTLVNSTVKALWLLPVAAGLTALPLLVAANASPTP